MVADVWTVIWKEWREILRQNGTKRNSPLTTLLMAAVMGILAPWQAGTDWVTTPVSLSLWGILPVVMISAVVADAFAGERERRTLETLLATRLSDRAILFGKIVATVFYAWGATQLAMLIALVTVNVGFWEGQIMFYPADVALVGIGLSFLLANLISTVGVLISLRAKTVKEAHQVMSYATVFSFFVPALALNVLPETWTARLGELVRPFLASSDVSQLMLVGAAVLIALTLGLLGVVLSRFRRSQLLLD